MTSSVTLSEEWAVHPLSIKRLCCLCVHKVEWMSDTAVTSEVSANISKQLFASWRSLVATRLCAAEGTDYESCLENSIPDNVKKRSFVDQSLRRKAIRSCDRYAEVLRTCVTNGESDAFRGAARHALCQEMRTPWIECKRRLQPSDSPVLCEKEAFDFYLCGLGVAARERNLPTPAVPQVSAT